VRGVDVQRAMVVAPRAGARADEGAERDGAAGEPLGRPRFGAEVVREDVELRVVRGGEVTAARPTGRGRDGERRPHGEGELHRRQVGVLERVPLSAGGHEPARRHAELPRAARLGRHLRRGGARRCEEQTERADGGERLAGRAPASGAGRTLERGECGRGAHGVFLAWGDGWTGDDARTLSDLESVR
jgi:hypothetical protein